MRNLFSLLLRINSSTKKHSNLTLIEIAIIVFILAILAG